MLLFIFISMAIGGGYNLCYNVFMFTIFVLSFQRGFLYDLLHDICVGCG